MREGSFRQQALPDGRASDTIYAFDTPKWCVKNVRKLCRECNSDSALRI